MKKIELTEWENKLLKEIKKRVVKTQGRCVIATIPHVSRSGMSRVVKFAFINKKSELLQINYLVSKINNLNFEKKYNGLKINGCGMDMIFHTLSNFYANIGIKDFSSCASNYFTF